MTLFRCGNGRHCIEFEPVRSCAVAHLLIHSRGDVAVAVRARTASRTHILCRGVVHSPFAERLLRCPVSRVEADVSWTKALQRGFGRATEPLILFPLIAAALLAVIGAGTYGLIRLKYTEAERAASVSARELLDTYEAQVVRALREIDQTLNLVKYWHARDASHAQLSELADIGLLPPDLVFIVSIADA